MKYLIFLFVYFLLSSCSSFGIPSQNNNDLIYNEIRFKIIDLVDVEQVSRKFNLIYTGTEDNYHLLVALPLDKFSFNETDYFALDASECPMEHTHYPEQALFYNLKEMEDWKAIKVMDGLCVIEEASQLRFLF